MGNERKGVKESRGRGGRLIFHSLSLSIYLSLVCSPLPLLFFPLSYPGTKPHHAIDNASDDQDNGRHIRHDPEAEKDRDGEAAKRERKKRENK